MREGNAYQAMADATSSFERPPEPSMLWLLTAAIPALRRRPRQKD